MQKIKIWQVGRTDGGQRDVVSLEEVGDAEAEDLLEDLLVQEPHMLTPSLKLVGRQVETQDGPPTCWGWTKRAVWSYSS